MPRHRHILLLDLDNCPGYLAKLADHVHAFDRVIACHGVVEPKIGLNVVKRLAGAIHQGHIEFLGMSRGGKNAADFAIAFLAGQLATSEPADSEFLVVSHDQGLDHVIELLRRNGRRARRVSPPADIAAVIAPSKSTIAIDGSVAIDATTEDPPRRNDRSKPRVVAPPATYEEVVRLPSPEDQSGNEPTSSEPTSHEPTVNEPRDGALGDGKSDDGERLVNEDDLGDYDANEQAADLFIDLCATGSITLPRKRQGLRNLIHMRFGRNDEVNLDEVLKILVARGFVRFDAKDMADFSPTDESIPF